MPEYVFDATVMENVIARQDGAELVTQRFAADAIGTYHAQVTPKMAAHYAEGPINDNRIPIAP